MRSLNYPQIPACDDNALLSLDSRTVIRSGRAGMQAHESYVHSVGSQGVIEWVDSAHPRLGSPVSLFPYKKASYRCTYSVSWVGWTSSLWFCSFT